ncbi:hormogonium polysaccharide biosynthesis protein HpsA [Sodalinema gerasimenkoae]|uniref:hormogonium polysaccharide biosynthesis protein HpsA n=1 Tax=Sodalinema gerasimenkoae TaxID=2862348 RepID=UPI001357A4E2|nr:hormogonium polysaccharide biosynthesis protein HpsA [Sodalinema gerasimenkoae]
MANPHIWTPIKRWLRNTGKRLYTQFARQVRRLLQRLAPPRRRRSQGRMAGFVLPTAVMLLLVLSLIVGAILLRTISRTEQVMLSRRDRVIYNAATPAIDRAKAKLEFMFDREQEPRLPQGIPSQDFLKRIMLNQVVDQNDPVTQDPYTLPGETRIDINGDGQLDNAWTYQEDSNGDGENDLSVSYSIIWNFVETNLNAQGRAQQLFVRQGPVSAEPKPGCGTEIQIENGWLRDPDSSAILNKNFQINAFVRSTGEDRAVTTLEVQQERLASRLNKWGAWFRNDLEVFPGPDFKWNGAMYSGGNFMVGHRRRTDRFQAYLISGPGSCLYKAGPDTSEISVVAPRDDDDDEQFTGQIMVGFMPEDISSGGGIFHIYPEDETENPNVDNGTTLTPQNDSVATGTPSQAALDPIILFTQDRSQHRQPNQVRRDGNWSNTTFVEGERIINKQATRPLIDDFYRADNRYGPRPIYGGDENLDLIELGVEVGEPIPAQQDELISLTATTGEEEDDDEDSNDGFIKIGLDGYWERRAWREGMRVIVGQRLELGNDPFASPTQVQNNSDIPQLVDVQNLTNNREHESLQRRSFRDNLAAAQTTAVYHWSEGADDADERPVAGILTTVHPGTAETLKRGAIFEKPQINAQGQFGVKAAYSALFGPNFGDDDDELLIDFFTGRGTNGWELDVSELDIINPSVVDALENLANFAGDPDGAFPAVQRPGEIHPNPALTEWGNFSNLRRTLDDDLESLADYTNKHTAAMTLGALAYNVSYLDALDYGSVATELTELADRLEMLRDADLGNGEVIFLASKPSSTQEWNDLRNRFSPTLPTEYDDMGLSIFDRLPDEPSLLMVDDSGNVIVRTDPTPETYIEALEYTGAGFEPYQELARLIYLKEQVKRDREFGFLPSPTGREGYQTNNYVVEIPELATNGGEPGEDGEDGEDEGDLNVSVGDFVGAGTSICPADEDCLEVTSVNGTATVKFLPGFALGSGDEYPVNANGELALPLSFGCDIQDHDFFGLSDTPEGITLANNLCGATPKFPSLYYIFPTDDHGYRNNTSLGEEQPQAENDISGTWVADEEERGIMDLGRDLNNNGSLDDEIWYTSDPYINTVTTHTYRSFSEADLVSIAIKPVAGIENFVLPYDEDFREQCSEEFNGRPNPNCQEFNLIYDGEQEQYHRVAFKDTAFYVGRDKLNARSLNMDLELLANKVDSQANGTTPTGGDTWLAKGDDTQRPPLEGGIVYAFREDAVREDGIERPPGGTCQSINNIGNGCNTEVIRNIDPQVNPDNGISAKAVNFNPDPDRQIHGFRMINGEDISRQPLDQQPFGLSFISDNPAWVQGNFNCHKSPGGNCDQVIEEFQFTLSTQNNWGPNEFYNRRRRTNDLDRRFADLEQDSWRYTEFLVDAFGILSDNFCDGSVEDSFLVVPATGTTLGVNTELTQSLRDLERSSQGRSDQVYGCNYNAARQLTSYSSTLRPNGSVPSNAIWLRENPADPGSPIRISPNGNPRSFLDNSGDFSNGEYDGGYFEGLLEPHRRLLIEAPRQQRVNAMMISGIPPSRAQQSYGGLHNFPRFNEEWDSKDLLISGAFLQLNFSNYATGPYDHDAWEPRGPNSQPQAPEFIGYYGAPNRLWGYDVALQLARVAPISARLVEVERVRSEFYREPSADDPYIRNLRCAAGPDGDRLDPNVTGCP